MDINWRRWLLERLPFTLKVNRVYVFCLLFTQPVRMLYDIFTQWKKKMRNRSGASPQVCMLKKVVYDELGVNIEIEEMNGKPHDFVVKASQTDTDKDRQIIALLNRYKIAGKTYQYINEEVTFSSHWEDYICEQCEFTTTWTNYVCEQISKTEIFINIRPYYSSEYLKVEIQPSQALPRAISVIFGGLGGIKFFARLPAGMTTKQTFQSPPGFELTSAGLNIWEDIRYKYKLGDI